MNDYKIWLGGISIAIAFVSYIPYFWHIYQGKTKPHAFSWLIWGILQAIGFAAQLVGHGGAGTWATAVTSLICFTIAGVAFWKGENKFILFDWLSLAGAGLAIFFWWLTSSPVISVILITISDLIGFLPTYRKAYHKPNEETLISYMLSTLKEVISLFALSHYNFLTGFYITMVSIANMTFVTMVFIRRKKML
ncbi:MAG: hypothetical protein KW802_04575 [Candidatus Doudnabacteria bacterium]|nr:hypothetical protein [Candidatus Doudnabacteria bacterium]